MAQLKNTLIQGSARVTDTLYANSLKTVKFEADLIVPKSLAYASDVSGGINYNYNTTVQGHIGLAAASTATSALLGLYCTGDIVLRPRGTIDNNNTFSSTTGIKITSTDLQPTGTMSLGTASTRWNKFYIQNAWYSYSGASQYPFDLVLYNQTPVIVGETWYNCGNATNVTTGQWNWRQYSPAATATTTTSGKFETYSLPIVANGLTENKAYTIITTKNLSSITTVGTITSGTWQGTAIASSYIGSHNHNASNINAGTLGVARGGTGADTFTADCVIVGNGTNAMASRGLKVTGAVGAATTLTTTTDKALTITSGSTLYLDSKASTSTVFRKGTTECARFNTQGNLALGSSAADAQGTQNTHKLYVNGDSAFNGKIAFGAQTSNAITEKLYMQYDTTTDILNFVFV